MSTAWRAPAGTLVAFLALIVSALAAASPASAAVVINEVETEGAPDWVELFNTDAAPVNIGNWVLKDSGNGNDVTIPPATMIPGSGHFAINVTGLGNVDSARLLTDAAVLVDSSSWGDHAPATWGRCPDGTGAITWTSGPTRGTANSCPLPAVAWPGDSAISIASDVAFGSNLSGLAYQPSGSSAPGVLWAVRNGPSSLFRLVSDGTKWTPDAGWNGGKQLVYPNGTGVPDAEGVTLAGGDPNAVYVATERNDAPPDANTSRPAVLRYDVTGAGPLTATDDWDLTADLPLPDENAGLEAITWIPGDVLVSKGFVDETTGLPYSPAAYPGHVAGLFFVGVEEDGRIIAYALSRTAGTATRVASIASGWPSVMALEYEPESTLLWAVCDNTCDGRSATLDVAQSGVNDGRFVVTKTYDRPAGMANLNNEGFAIAPQAECVNGLKPVIWSDDTNTAGQALRAGKLNCTPTPTPTPTPTATPTPVATPVVVPAATPTPPPPGPVDRTAPGLSRVSLRFTKSGTFAVRRTGKFRVTLTLGERANLTITASARKNARSRARTLLKTTRNGVAAGKPAFTLSLKRSVRAALRKGETVTLTIAARDAAGNVTTRRVKAKVP